jgi:molybdopterin molybdotransferase
MITFENALQIILDATRAKRGVPDEKCEYISLEEACGRILQQAVTADRDMPPFDKSAMDGYACLYSDMVAETPLRLLETIPAGSVAKYAVTTGTCSKIMTGAALPLWADYVLMVEETWEENGFIYYTSNPKRKANICYKGEDLNAGMTVLHPGCLIQPQHIAVLAAVGCTKIRVAKRVRVGIISTGDELTEPWESPETVQIRNSNGWQLLAQSKQAGALATYYGIAKDSADLFAPLLSTAIKESDVVIVSGGVSMGDFDIVPETAQRLGIDILFDRVAVQPGKPTTFGVGPDGFFFGLPGNPVSSFIQFELMVKPLLMQLMGAHYTPLSLRLPLAHPYHRKQAERMAHLPAKIDPSGSCLLLNYHGSGHINSLEQAQGLVRIPIGVTSAIAGEPVEIILL